MSGCGCGHGHGGHGAADGVAGGHQHGAGVAQAAAGTATAVKLETTVTADGVTLSDGAASKVKSLLEQEGRDDLALRIAVQPGGCSGLRYQLFFDERTLDGDTIREFDGVNVVVDRMSLPYLHGATIDFVDTIEKQGFTIDNPQASGSCACGDSFH
jgi:iron-sulfur cluster assembly accessory protein